MTDPSALPLVSPDLRYQATVRETREQSRHELRLLDTTTGRTRVLKGVNPADASSVVWSPDARTLAVVEQEENRHVVTVDVAWGGCDRPARGLSVSYSREGRLLVVRGRGFDELWSSETENRSTVSSGCPTGSTCSPSTPADAFSRPGRAPGVFESRGGPSRGGGERVEETALSVGARPSVAGGAFILRPKGLVYAMENRGMSSNRRVTWLRPRSPGTQRRPIAIGSFPQTA